MQSSTAARHDIPASTGSTERLFVTVTAADHLTSARANAASGAAPHRRKLKPVIKTTLGKHLSKSLSTPQLRGLVMSESEAQKRNKLGYQRISIACAHCRRRKIRCLPTDDEKETRCQNCIRLKKECVYYPVDQQAAIDARSEASNRTGDPSASSTVSSSPNQAHAQLLEDAQHQFVGGFPSIPSDGTRSYQGIPIVPNLSVPSQANFAHPEHGFQARAGDTTVAWSPKEFGTQSAAMPMGDAAQIPQHFVRYGQQNMTVDTAPYPGSIEQSPQNMDQFGYVPGPALQQQWQHHPQHQQPVRSMSYPNNYGAQYNPTLQQGPPASPYVQSSSFQQHPSAAQMIAMAPGHGNFVGTPASYMTTPDQRSISIPNPSPYHVPPPQQMWPPYQQTIQEPRTIPSQIEDDGYTVRPG